MLISNNLIRKTEFIFSFRSFKKSKKKKEKRNKMENNITKNI